MANLEKLAEEYAVKHYRLDSVNIDTVNMSSAIYFAKCFAEKQLKAKDSKIKELIVNETMHLEFLEDNYPLNKHYKRDIELTKKFLNDLKSLLNQPEGSNT